MNYQDFRIRIEAKKGEGYDVSVESPAGNADEHIILPFDVDELTGQLHQMGSSVRSAGTREIVIEGPEPIKPSEFGDQLFKALFSGRVAKLYNAMSRDLQDPNTGLRISLHLNLNDPGVGALAAVPWEYVYDADTMDYLNLSTQTPIVRYLDVQRPNTVQSITGKLKVLVVMSSPKGVHELDLDKERKLIESIWADDNNVELVIKEHPTPNDLRIWLTSDQYHVLHYMGHGAHDEKTGIGALVLEDGNQNVQLLDAETLGTFLRNAPTVRLAFLNACDLGKTSEDSPFSGVANRLVMAGLPAVVAMQFPISDDAAIRFARTFYRCMERGMPVDEAVAHGRTAILAGQPGSMEWGTPVLYMRTPDGRLFERANETADTTETPQVQMPSQPVADSATKMKIGAAAGIVAALVAIAAAIFFLASGGSQKLAFDVTAADALTAFIDVPKRLIVGPVKNDGSTDYLGRYKVTISVPAGVSGVTVGDTAIVNDVWQADVTASTEGKVEILATIEDKSKNDDESRKKSVTLSVLIDPAVQAAYNDAIGSIKSADVSTETIVENLGQLEGLGLSNEMRTEVVTLKSQMEELVKMRRLAEQSFGSETILLSDKISAFGKWKSGLISARGIEATATFFPEPIQQYEQLQSRTDVTGFMLCNSSAECAGASRLRAGKVYEIVTYEPGVVNSRVTVKYFAKPGNEVAKEKEFNLQGSTTSFSWSNVSRGSYDVRLYNKDGDLLKSADIEIN